MPAWLARIILRSEWLQSIYYRVRCPAGGKSARACIKAGDCGCDNKR